jgi:hypothetical protein
VRRCCSSLVGVVAGSRWACCTRSRPLLHTSWPDPTNNLAVRRGPHRCRLLHRPGHPGRPRGSTVHQRATRAGHRRASRRSRRTDRPDDHRFPPQQPCPNRQPPGPRTHAARHRAHYGVRPAHRHRRWPVRRSASRFVQSHVQDLGRTTAVPESWRPASPTTTAASTKPPGASESAPVPSAKPSTGLNNDATDHCSTGHADGSATSPRSVSSSINRPTTSFPPPLPPRRNRREHPGPEGTDIRWQWSSETPGGRTSGASWVVASVIPRAT